MSDILSRKFEVTHQVTIMDLCKSCDIIVELPNKVININTDYEDVDTFNNLIAFADYIGLSIQEIKDMYVELTSVSDKNLHRVLYEIYPNALHIYIGEC